MLAETLATAGQGVDHGSSADRATIRELIENWVVWRDAGDWDRFATLWHEDGQMVATWCQAPYTDFIASGRKLFEQGVTALHLLGGSNIDINGTRATSQTKMQIFGTGTVDGVAVNVSCVGRFVDALEKRDGRWGLVRREPVYDLDWLTTVDPSATLVLDPELLGLFPTGYRHMGYVQTQSGLTVKRDLPCTHGPAIEALFARMHKWLDGEPASCLDA